jgi:hypothetical protein
VNKLILIKNNDGYYEFTLIDKSSLKIKNIGTMTHANILEHYMEYIMCFLDGYAFDIVYDCYV